MEETKFLHEVIRLMQVHVYNMTADAVASQDGSHRAYPHSVRCLPSCNLSDFRLQHGTNDF